MNPTTLTKADFMSDQEVRWCPGCGDYAILSQVQKTLPTLGIPRENVVFISGIGCSSRFPYYMNTYGMHTIHGRAPAIASGVKICNPQLSVWVITGDGDGFSIGGNHMIHILRRNLDVNIILFNNRIYGLTKGQYSPTSEFHKKTKSSPFGTVEHPIHPLSVAIAAEATFVARAFDTDAKNLSYILKRAHEHKGVSFIEVYQNCNIFNDGAYRHITEKTVRADRILYLEHGKPMIFGKERNKGLRLRPDASLEVVTIGENGITENDILVHDETRKEASIAFLLSQLDYPEFPVPMGVFRCIQKTPYEELLEDQITACQEKFGKGDLEKLFHSGDTWTV
ncbi:MAG: 2-oxoacid:ferredoxin oxidoreductase subunit beta [Planctomycetota bacterium]|nr:MAG: 2-oxoacid:ferredoxin oxidoreductase subunit beta [Planctomycetota bacterium]